MQALYWIPHSYKFLNVWYSRILGEINFPGFPELSHKYSLIVRKKLWKNNFMIYLILFQQYVFGVCLAANSCGKFVYVMDIKNNLVFCQYFVPGYFGWYAHITQLLSGWHAQFHQNIISNILSIPLKKNIQNIQVFKYFVRVACPISPEYYFKYF